MATQAAAHGFWRGFFTGLVLAAAAALALAWFYPPQPLMAPEVDPGSLEAPAAPGQPQGAAEPEAPRSEALLPAAPAKPLIADVPRPDAVPEAAGSPSLVPKATP